MNEKEKLEQPKLVEVEESPPEVVESSSQCADAERTPENAEPTSAPVKAEVAAYGDLEASSATDLYPNIDGSILQYDRDQLIRRCFARLIDAAIVSVITTAFTLAVLSAVVVTGGDEQSLFLRGQQQALQTSQVPFAINILAFNYFFTMIPGLTSLGFLSSALYHNDFSVTIPSLYVFLGPIILVLYQTTFIASKSRASIGKMIMGIQMVGQTGAPLSLSRCFLRELIFLFESVFFHIPTGLPALFNYETNSRPLHDILAGATSIRRQAGFSANEMSALAPFGLSILSVAILVLGGLVYESTYGREAGAKEVETAKALFGENSDTYLRQLWRYTEKRVIAGDYNRSQNTEADFAALANVELKLMGSWGIRDSRVRELNEDILTKSGIARYPDQQEKLLQIATNFNLNSGDSKYFTPYGDLCQLYLGKIKGKPLSESRNTYQEIYKMGKLRLANSDNKYTFLAAYLSATEALGYESDLKDAMNDMAAVPYSIEDMDRLHWSYWDYRLFQLVLADYYMQRSNSYAASHIISSLADWETQPGNEAKLRTPREKPNLLEEQSIENLSHEFPRLAVQLKPSYWRYSQ